VSGSATAIARMRDTALASGAGPLVGHFGTYGAHVAGELETLLPALVSRLPAIRLALIGSGSGAFLDRLAHSTPRLAERMWASDRLDAPDVAAALRACDLLVQPYPDGITTRRTSVMAGLKNGVATVSTSGELTEPVWRETGAVALAPAGDVAALVERVAALLRDDSGRAALAGRGQSTYAARFSMEHTVSALRDGVAS
jgi:glycosyltransferase involved in cell wall biosynthesis